MAHGTVADRFVPVTEPFDQHSSSECVKIISTTTTNPHSELTSASTMLSNPPPTASNLHSRQRLHRRQNSTPTAFEAVKIAPLPNFRYQQQPQGQQQQQQRSHVSHRRGMSLDTRGLQLQRPSSSATSPIRQEFSPVSNNTTNNQGLSTTPQHVMRETQQQRTARLGPSQSISNGQQYASNNRRNNSIHRHSNDTSRSSCHSRNSSTTSTSSVGSLNHFGIDESNNYLISPHGTPQAQRFVNVMPKQQNQFEDMSMSFGPYLSQMNAMMQKGQQGYEPSQDFELYAPDSALSTPTFLTFAEASPGESPQQGWMSEGDTTNNRRTSRRISNGLLDRIAKFETMGAEPVQAGRPYTPPQTDNSFYPPTPMETPHDRMTKHDQQRPNRFSDNYDESLEETIKPVRGNRKAQLNTGVFEQMRQQAEAQAMAQQQQQQQQSNHQRTNTMSSTYTDNSGISTADFIDMTAMDQFVKIEGDFEDDLDLDHASPPMHPHMASFSMAGAFDQKHTPSLQQHDSQSTVKPTHSSTQSSRHGTPHRRTESLASIVSAASISSINIEETKTDTGVTIDEIQTFIAGPDADAKWTCIYESCGKKFGRKENIKSHVQTHLNDRQYQCPSCKKCFVRQHDLKRHAKIHTGIKPYPCECGNSFARHDALTRHRQRGMCIGAFDGVVRKVVKRGRPRKHRPDMEDRLVKSDMTRRKVKASENASRHGSTHSSASSQSGYSDSSAGNSPSNSNDFDGVLDDAPFPDMDMMDVNNMPDLTSSPFESAHHSSSSRTPSTATTSPALISSAFMPSSSTFDDTTTRYTTVSPEQITAPSPAVSNYSYTHNLPTLAQNPSPAPNSPAKSTTSNNYTHRPCPSVHSPPELELSASSSPPPASSATLPQSQPPRFFDLTDDSEFDPNQSTMSDHSIGLGTTVAAHQAAVSCGRGDLSGLGMDDMLLQFGSGEEMMMGGGKYFEDVDVQLFGEGEEGDVFFN